MARLLSFIAFGAILWPSFGPHPAVNRQPANIVGPVDGRQPVVSNFSALKLSAQESAQIRNAVGYINCGSSDGWVTAFLAAPDVVVTVAHVSLGKGCFFQTQGDQAGVKYELSGRPEDVVVGSARPLDERQRDWAVARLQRPVRSARPVRILNGPIELREWTEIIPVSAYRGPEYQLRGESPDEPLAQLCRVRRVFPAAGATPSLFYSDCDNTSGGSGSPVLVRLTDGQLAVAGMFIRTGWAPDKSEYSEGSPKSLAASLGLDADFLRAVRKMIQTQPVPAFKSIHQTNSATQFILAR